MFIKLEVDYLSEIDIFYLGLQRGRCTSKAIYRSGAKVARC